MNEMRKLMLIKGLGLNAPLLDQWKLMMRKPILLTVPDGRVKPVIEILLTKGSLVLDPGSSLKEVVPALKDGRHPFVFLPYYPDASKLKAILEYLSRLLKVGMIDGKPLLTTVIAVTDDQMVFDAEHTMFSISIEETGELNPIPSRDVVPEDDELKLVEEQIRIRLKDKNAEDVEKAFLATACFLYPMLADKSEFLVFEDVVRQMAEGDLAAHEDLGLSEMFIGTLYDWVNKKRFEHAYCLPKIPDGVEFHPKTTVFLEENFIYFSDEMFRQVVATMHYAFGTNTLKRILKQDKILIPGSDVAKTYTVKMGYRKGVTPARETMLRFSAEKLVKDGSIRLCDRIKLIYGLLEEDEHENFSWH